MNISIYIYTHDIHIYIYRGFSNPLELWTAITWYREQTPVDISVMFWGVAGSGAIKLLNGRSTHSSSRPAIDVRIEHDSRG